MSYPPVVPCSTPRGKGMLVAVITGVLLLLSSLGFGALFVLELMTSVRLEPELERARQEAVTSVGDYAAALQTAQSLSAFFLISTGVAVFAGIGVEVAGVAVWVSQRKQIAAGKSPHAMLRLGMPAIAVVIVFLLLAVGLGWQTAAGFPSSQWVAGHRARDAEEKIARDRQNVITREDNRRKKILDAINVLNSDAKDAQRRIAYRYLAMDDRGGLIELLRTEELRRDLKAGLLRSRDLVASDEEMRRQFESFQFVLDPGELPEHWKYFAIHRCDHLDPKSDAAGRAAVDVLKSGQHVRATLEHIFARGVSPDSVGDIGDTLLTAAIELDLSEFPAFLLSHGANPNLANRHGNFPLFLAAEKNNIQLVNLLLEKGADVNARIHRPADAKRQPAHRVRGRTALSLATGHMLTDIIKALLDAGADPNIPDEAERTPLDYLRTNQSGGTRTVPTQSEKAILEKEAKVFADLPAEKKALAKLPAGG